MRILCHSLMFDSILMTISPARNPLIVSEHRDFVAKSL